MTEERERRILKSTVDTTLSGLQPDAFLAQKVIRQAKGEKPVKKKLSFAFILTNLLVLAAVTAFAVSIHTENPDKQPLNPAATLVPIAAADEIIPMADAIDIAKNTIRARYGVPDEEMDQLMIVPYSLISNYGAHSHWNWRVIFYSNRNRVLQSNDAMIPDLYAGPLGEYDVSVNAKTGEVEACEWYTADFWKNAQRIWDAGNYNDVYRHYFQDDFHRLPLETQAHFTQLLKEQGYTVQSSPNRHSLLSAYKSEILVCAPEKALPDDDPQAQAAWLALKERNNLDTDLMKTYSYIATRAPWESKTDDVVIAYNVPSFMEKHASGQIRSVLLYPEVQRIGMYLISFEKGTTRIVDRVRYDYYAFDIANNSAKYTVETNTGLLLNMNLKWNNNELEKFHESFLHLEEMMDMMDAVQASDYEKIIATLTWMIELGSQNEDYYRETGIPTPQEKAAATHTPPTNEMQ